MTRKRVVPPKIAEDSQRINLIVDKKWLDQLDAWRKKQDGAIRKIVEQATKSTDKKPRVG